MIQYNNYSFQTEIKCEDNEIFDSCNFSQQNPHTKVMFTGKNITITDSNITNCEFDENVNTKLIAYHTDKSLDEMKMDQEQYLIDNPPEKTEYTKDEVIQLMIDVGVSEEIIQTVVKPMRKDFIKEKLK